MFMNGARTGMGLTVAVLKRIRAVVPMARAAFSGVVVVTQARGAVAFQIGTAATLRTGS